MAPPPSLRYRLLACVLLATSVLLTSCDKPGEEEDEDEQLVVTEQGLSCGVERWAVKTGTDADISKFNRTPVSTTISTLRGYTKPSSYPDSNRIGPQELTTYKLTNVTLTQYKLEDDSDYHLVLSDGTNTVIAEIPAPGCVGTSSPWATDIKNARAAFDAKYTATTSFKTANATVTVVGAGFFDLLHGQTGVAPNGIELHAIFSICFGLNCAGSSGGDTTAPTTSITAPTAGATVSGTAVTVSASASDNVGVSKVEFYADGALVATDTTSPYSISWNSTGVANGSHTLTSKAYDAAGNVGTSAGVSVNVSNSTGSCATTSYLFGNPGFESGNTVWTASSGVITNSTSETPHAGSWMAWLDGYGAATTDDVYQSVSIPSNACSATLSFWLHVDTAETSTTTAYDTLTVTLRDSAGTVLSTLGTYSNLNAAAGYTQKTFDVSSYKGQTVRVQFHGVEDSSLQTSFVIDDTSMKATQ